MTIIKDKVLGKYFIQIDDNNYTVFKVSGKVDANNKPINYLEGYWPTLSGALTQIAKLQVNSKLENRVVAIKEYIQETRQVINEIKLAIKNW